MRQNTQDCVRRRICRGKAEGVFRRNAISRESPVHQRQVGGLEPTVAREHVCGPDVISTATVNGAREISAGQSPLAKQVARAVRARRNHVGGVPASCGSGEQVGPSPRLPKPKLAPPRTRHRYTSDGATHMPRGSGRLGDAPLPMRRQVILNRKCGRRPSEEPQCGLHRP